jgi:hypothetical protein
VFRGVYFFFVDPSAFHTDGVNEEREKCQRHFGRFMKLGGGCG